MNNCKLVTIVLITLIAVFGYYMYKASSFEHMGSCNGTTIRSATGSYCKYTDADCKRIGCIKATGSRPGMSNTCLC